MLSEWEGTAWSGTAVETRSDAPTPGSLDDFVARLGYANRAYRLPSIREALGVPSVLRANSLIANTTGMLAVEGYRNGALMDEAPRLIARPDPFNTPRDFYRDAAFGLSSRGECVLWIAARDNDKMAAALIVVPLHELVIEENTRNRLFPVYRWGKVEGTRYSPANPAGEFVHVTYLKEHPLALRGVGPLQLCGSAMSVSVEAQEWAANFYADGGYPSIGIESAVALGTEKDEDGNTEADRLRNQWIDKPHNVPRVWGPNAIAKVHEFNVNQQGAQMLEARNHQNGETARAYGIPGSLLDYGSPGSSLTYQNVAEEYAKFVRTCLSPNYLEPLEQALTDLLPRSTVARFNVKGLLRADIKTRFEVYEKAIATGIYDVEYAQREEGIVPGSIEIAPVPFAPPAAIPASIPDKTRSAVVELDVRCDGMATKRRGGISRIERCNRLLSRTGDYIGRCPRCKKEFAAA